MRKPIIRNHYVTDSNIPKDTLFAVLSDIHFSSRNDEIKKINLLYRSITKIKPDYICIPGDLVDSTKTLLKKENRKKIKDFLKELAKIAPTILSFGNHDFHPFKDMNQITSKKVSRFYQTIQQIPNLYVLNNTAVTIDSLCFIGYTQSRDYYQTRVEDKNYMKKEMKELLTIKPNSYGILLCHSPIHILDSTIVKEVPIMKWIHLIFSGHMHNGLVPPLLDKLWKGNKGLITPKKQLFPFARQTRGLKQQKDKTLIISGGITKIQNCAPKLLYPLNVFFPMHIEQVFITKDRQNKKNVL